MKKIIISSAIVLLVGSIVGCQGYSVTGGPGKNASPSLKSESNRTKDLLTINSLFVAPVEVLVEIRSNPEVNFDFSSQLRDAVREEIDLRVFYAGAVDSTGSGTTVPFDEAKRVKADGILLTKVTNFVPREGSAVGSERPAQVDFSMQVLRVSDGRSLWQSSYHFKDQSLSENLFKIKDRLSKGATPQFRSAEDLIRSGYRSALNNFSKQRLAQFASEGH